MNRIHLPSKYFLKGKQIDQPGYFLQGCVIDP